MSIETELELSVGGIRAKKPKYPSGKLGYTIGGAITVEVPRNPAFFYVRFPDGGFVQAYHDGKINSSAVSAEVALLVDSRGKYHITGLQSDQASAYIQLYGSGILVPNHFHPATDIITGVLAHERGGLEADVSGYDGYPFISGGTTSQKKAKLNATATPTTGDDNLDGYSIGSLWIDTTHDKVYQATDVSTGAAVWKDISVTDASEVSFTPGSGLTSTNAQDAIEEAATLGGGGGGGGGSGSGASELLLNYSLATDVFSNTPITASTWTDVTSNQSFTVPSLSNIQFDAIISMLIVSDSGGATVNSRLVIDSGGTPIYIPLAGMRASAAEYASITGGAFTIENVSSGSHTIKLQINPNANCHAYLRASSIPSEEYVKIQALRLGSGVIVDMKRSVGTTGITTTSTSRTPVDSSGMGFTQHGGYNLRVGDVVECVLHGQIFTNGVDTYTYLDVEVDQPTSGNVYVGNTDGSYINWLAGGRRQSLNMNVTFIATEAGIHAFRPVWKSPLGVNIEIDGSNTPTVFTTKLFRQ